MKQKALTLTAFIFSLAIAFSLGYGVAARRANRCEAKNKVLLDDLTRAVSTGVALHVDLTRCKEQIVFSKPKRESL